MKLVWLILTLMFSMLFVVRVIEMSIEFDGIDVLWAFIFVILGAICGAGYGVAKDGE